MRLRVKAPLVIFLLMLIGVVLLFVSFKARPSSSANQDHPSPVQASQDEEQSEQKRLAHEARQRQQRISQADHQRVEQMRKLSRQPPSSSSKE